MTIDEAIQYAEDLGTEEENKIDYDKDSPHMIICRKNTVKDYRQLAEWLTELKHLRDEVHRMKPDLDDKNRALKEAKRLLKLAVDDANSEAESLCAFCKHNHVVDGCPYIESYSECEYIWRYTDEALKLIKEEK